jgi:hypothetical protein
VLTHFTDLKYVDETVEGYQDFEPGFRKDAIAAVRSLVNAVSSKVSLILKQLIKEHQIRHSSMKKQRFSEYVRQIFEEDYQLLHDVVTRWSSTLLMISRFLKLREVDSL